MRWENKNKISRFLEIFEIAQSLVYWAIKRFYKLDYEGSHFRKEKKSTPLETRISLRNEFSKIFEFLCKNCFWKRK